MSYDLVIRNGLVIDGTGSPAFEADVAVEGESISGIPKNLGLGQKEDGVRAIVFMLEEAVWKVTGLPSSKFKLNRGNLKKGWPADITVFDPDKIQDLVSERLPARVDEKEVKRHPLGIEAVIVNGKVVVEKGECNDIFSGKVTRQELCAEVTP